MGISSETSSINVIKLIRSPASLLTANQYSYATSITVHSVISATIKCSKMSMHSLDGSAGQQGQHQRSESTPKQFMRCVPN